ncbi:MAG: hypothetical protein ACTHK4_15545 [Mycobacteriales bacterium]
MSTGRLYLVGGQVSGGTREVAIQGQASEPVWSHDGHWLAVIVQPPPPKPDPYADEPATVWLVSRSGEVVRRLTSPTGRIRDVGLAWSPTADRLAMTYTLRNQGHVDLVGADGARSSLVTAPTVSLVAWSPDGRHLAVGRNRFHKPITATSWRSEIDVFAARGGIPRVIATHRGGILDVAGWWPDGSGVLAWIDPMGSGSIAADGLRLYDFDVHGGRRFLGGTLEYRPWIAASQVRNEVALIVGGDRELTNQHKHLVVCSLSTCRSVPQRKDEVSFDPAFASDGRLAVVRDRAVSPTAHNGAFGPSFTAKVDASGVVELVSGSANRAEAGGDGATAPVWGRDGSMLMVREGALWLKPQGSSRSQRVAGPLSLANDSDYFAGDPWDYYGFVGWWNAFAWSDAVR